MNKPRKNSAASLSARLTAVTLAIAAMSPLPAALAPFGGIGLVQAQSNPCAPSKPTKSATNPCAPMRQRAANPSASMKDQKAIDSKKSTNDCDQPKNPCAPARKCDAHSKG